MTAPQHPTCSHCGRQMTSWGVQCAVCSHALLIRERRRQSADGRTHRRVAVLATRDWPVESAFQRHGLDRLIEQLADEHTVDGQPPELVSFHASPAEHYATQLWEQRGLPAEHLSPARVMYVDALTTLDAAVLVRRSPMAMLRQRDQLNRCQVPVTYWHA